MKIYETDKWHRICTKGCELVYELLGKSPNPKEIRVTVYDHAVGFISKAYVDVDKFIDGSRGGPDMGLPENNEEEEEEYPKDIYGC